MAQRSRDQDGKPKGVWRGDRYCNSRNGGNACKRAEAEEASNKTEETWLTMTAAALQSSCCYVGLGLLVWVVSGII